MKKKALRIMSLLLVVFVFVSALPTVAAGAVSDTYTLITGKDNFTTGKYVLTVETGYAVGPMDGTWLSAVGVEPDGDSLTPTSDIICDISVEGEAATIRLSDGQYIKPKGGNNNGIDTGEYSWKWNFSDGRFVFAGTGDDTVYLASNKGSANKFRGYKTVTVTGNPNAYPYQFSLYKLSSGEEEIQVAAPMASVLSGEVDKGTEIILTSSTQNASIYYTLDGSDPTNTENNSRILYSSESKPVISENSTLKAVACLDGVYSAVQTINYTVKTQPTEPTQPTEAPTSQATDPTNPTNPTQPTEATAPVANGDKVVIYAPAYNKALSGSYNGFYNTAADVTVSDDGTVSGYTDAEIWTVIENGDGTYSFAYNGKNIGMGDSYSSMPLGEKNDKWTIEEAADGTYYIKNSVRNAYIEYYASKNNWSGYGKIASGSEGMFQLKFYKAEVEAPTQPTDPVETDKLEVIASLKSGASVTAGQKITLKSDEGAEIYYTVAYDGNIPQDPDVNNKEQKYTQAIEITETPKDGKPVTVKAVAYIPATDSDKALLGSVYTFTYKAPAGIDDYNLYFGQLHAHTDLSDGTGTVAQAFAHAAKVENLDYLALTDHSNSFEGKTGLPSAGTTHLADENAEDVNAAWHEGRQGARDINASESDFVGIYGFEMTWSGGSPGHINTFNSKGFESRNAAPYKKGDNYEVLQAYYDTLNNSPETISQFNHPGDTFGDFMDFALYDPVTDNQMTLVEVGNGEGAIGASGYFPSYSYYTRALDKGWHIAPTNNQDNHKGNWGDSNTARSVVLAKELSEESIYDALKNYRVYATEDNDLSIKYSLNGNAMGSILDKQDSINIEASISDPTDKTGKTKVEVIVNGGQTIAEKSFEGESAVVKFDNLTANYGYYYLRITQADKNIAVTAPVWVGESVNAGISNTTTDVAMPIKGDSINITSKLFNNLSDEMEIKSLTYTIEGEHEPFHTADVSTVGNSGKINGRGSYDYSFPYSASRAGGFNVNVVMKATIAGEDYTFTDVLKLSVTDSSIATKVLIDGTHYNDYVTGYYSGNMTNFINMGISDNIQVKVAQPGQEITSQTLDGVSLFIISAPLKYTSDYTGSAVPSVFEDSFIDTVRKYVADGGTVIVCGLADYQDSNSGLPFTSYEQANKLLKGIGSTMSINDDELIDQNENGGQPYRLYFDDYNYETSDPAVQKVLNGVKELGLTYSSYSGCSVNKGNGEAVVFGHDTTYSINSKEPAQGHSKPVTSYKDTYSEDTAVSKMGEVISMATEAVGNGRVYVSGTVFCSNFEVSSEDTITYSNGIIAKNILDSVKIQPVISSIEEARHGEFGQVFTVEGTVANGTAESGNAFFNTIYIQDENGNGINIFPIDDNSIQRGDRVRVAGSVSEYIGDKQLSAISVTLLEDKKNIVITDTTTKEANNYDENFGKLVRVKGKITDVKLAGGVVESISVLDNSGEECRVFIDGYIGYSDKSSQALEEFVKSGNYISAVGFVSHDAEGNRLRVRDRSEIMLQNSDGVIVNGFEAHKGDQIVFETKLSVSQLLAYISAEVSYTNNVLELSELSTSVGNGVLTSTKGSAEFDLTNGKISLEASSNNGYDFTDEKVFVKLVFNVIADEGNANITTNFTKLENPDKESVKPTTEISTVSVLSGMAKDDIYLGDVNGDKNISIADAILIQKHIANIITLDEAKIAVADVNSDGVISIADAILLQKVISIITYLNYPAKY